MVREAAVLRWQLRVLLGDEVALPSQADESLCK